MLLKVVDVEFSKGSGLWAGEVGKVWIYGRGGTKSPELWIYERSGRRITPYEAEKLQIFITIDSLFKITYSEFLTSALLTKENPLLSLIAKDEIWAGGVIPVPFLKFEN